MITDGKRMTWEEIEKTYPDSWVGLSKVDWEDGANVRSAVVLGSSETGDEFLSRQLDGEDVYTVYTSPNNLCPLGILAGGK
ncbi:MAG: hypothetical protein IKN43_00975 [Selenomonadaceae bacterium]|nr:hypothetical protein [Selenomonadaceae bacterium]